MTFFLIVLAAIGLSDVKSRPEIALAGTPISDIATVRSDPAVAYAATKFGVFKTEDGGHTWKKMRDGDAGLIAVAGNDTNTAYASSQTNFELVKTTDGGATWNRIQPDFASVLAVVPSDPATLYAALYNRGMSKTTDGGTTWSTIMSGLPLDFFYMYVSFGSGWEAESIAADPTMSSTVYVGKPQGLFKTTDGGTNWKQIAPIHDVTSVVIDATNPSIVYATFNGSGVVKSVDGGVTWSDTSLTDGRIRWLAMSSASPPMLYAGTADGVLYRSPDGGSNWSIVDDGLPRAPVSRLSVDASGKFLYTATTAGVYQYRFFDNNVAVNRLLDDPVRLPRLFDQSPDATTAMFVLPVVGTVKGVGALFSTEVVLVNKRDHPQHLVLSWLPVSPTANVSSFRMTLASATESDATLNIIDIADRLGMTGIGSLAVFATDDDDNVDTAAAIDGRSRIVVSPSDGPAPLSQTIAAARAPLLSNHLRAVATNLRQDAAFRTNVGIANLSADVHQFTIQVNGQRASTQLNVAVPPFSLEQIPVPAGEYGDMSILVSADAASRWIFYGSTINNSTRESQTTIGTAADN